MADPVRYSIGYSFSAFQANSPNRPLPAARLDDELANIAASTESLRSSVTDIRRADGSLANELVTYDSLAPEIRYLFDNGAVDNATLLAEAVDDATDAAAVALASQIAAEAAAAIAQAAVDPAPFLSGAAAPEITVAGATTTDIGAALSVRVAVSGAATINSFGASVKRLRFVRFSGASTLTHNAASLILLTGRSRTVRAGAQGIYLSDASGNWRELHFVDGGGASAGNPLYFAEQFAAIVGDGVADDRVGLQALIDIVSLAGGGTVVLTGGRSYRVVINAGVTDFGLILKERVKLDLNSATINLNCDGYVYGVRPMSYTTIQGPGTIRTAVSTGITDGFLSQAIWQSPISLGAAGGDMGTVANPKPYNQVHDWNILGVTLESVRDTDSGTMLCGNGGPYNGVIADCIFPDNATMFVAIGFDWSPVGAMSSADPAGAKALYLAGTDYSIHPHNITIERNKIGRWSVPFLGVTPWGSHGVRLSGCYDLRVRDNVFEQVTYAGIYNTGGDMSFEFAPVDVRRQACKNLVFENNSFNECGDYFGIVVETYPDNLWAAVNVPSAPGYPYTPLFVVDGYFVNTIIRGNRIASYTGVNTQQGVRVYFTRGCTVEDNLVEGFDVGIKVAINAVNVVVQKNHVSICRHDGILVDDSSGPPVNTVVKDNIVRRNVINGTSANANIRVNAATKTTIDGNLVGYQEDFALVGIRVDAGSIFASITNNFIYGTKTGGTAITIATDVDTVWVVRDNRYAGVDTFQSGLGLVPYQRDYNPAVPGTLITHARAEAASMTGSPPAPAAGAWGVGSTITIQNAASGGVYMVKLTATGWKTASTLS